MEESIINTLAYFDIFDYPLTFAEIKKFSNFELDITDDQLHDVIDSISIIQEANGYYYLIGRQEITIKRSERASISIQKFAKARIIAKILSYVPTIEYIGVSGSLSMNNASHSDDIDLFFVTKRKTLWLSRIIVNSILLLTRQKRSKNGKSVRDKICPNMFVDVGSLSFSGKRRSLYTAHEIVQLKTLFDKNDTHSLLFYKNKWIQDFFPNLIFPKVTSLSQRSKKKKIVHSMLHTIVIPLEKISYIIQRLYMGRHKPVEVMTKSRAFFHPMERKSLIMDMYGLRKKRYMKLYDDNVWVEKDEVRFFMEEKKIRILN